MTNISFDINSNLKLERHLILNMDSDTSISYGGGLYSHSPTPGSHNTPVGDINNLIFDINTSCLTNNSDYVPEYFSTEEDCLELIKEWAAIEYLPYYVYGILGTIVFAVGMLGNTFAIIVLNHPCLASATFLYLQALAIFDSIVLICMFVFYSLPTLSSAYAQIYGYIVPYITFFIPMTLTCSIYTTVGFTVDRYIAVCHPLRASRWCTIERARKTLALIVIGSFIFNLPKLFEVKTTGNGEYYAYTRTAFGENVVYQYAYELALYVVVLKLIPFGVLIGLNGLLIYRVRKSGRVYMENATRQRRENNLTKMLIVVVMVFLICMAPSIVDNYYAITLTKRDLSRAYFMRYNYASTLLVITNSALNFYVYCLFGNKFRRAFTAVIVDCEWSRLRRLAASRTVSSLQPTMSSAHTNSSIRSGPRGEVNMAGHNKEYCQPLRVTLANDDQGTAQKNGAIFN